jgi:SAM-dependent methyltransferase
MTVAAERTDWDTYYKNPFPAAKFSRRVTERTLVHLFRRYSEAGQRPVSMVEIGGANSCFFDRINAEFRQREYHVVDFNKYGLDRMAERLGPRPGVQYHHEDVLNLSFAAQADLVFSVGLIEHFDPAGTARAIEAHFRLCRPGGTVVITFPTPTLPYRACRGVAELLGVWKFPDERPLRRPEVEGTMAGLGRVLHGHIIWPIVLTQGVLVARRSNAAGRSPA